MHEGEGVVKHVGEHLEGKHCERRRLEREEDGEGEEGKRDQARSSARRPERFVDRVGWGDDDGWGGPFDERGAVVEQPRAGFDIVCSDETEDEREGEEEEDGDELAVRGKGERLLPTGLSPVRTRRVRQSFPFDDDSTDGKLSPDGAEGAFAESDFVRDGEKDEDEGKDKVEGVDVSGRRSAVVDVRGSGQRGVFTEDSGPGRRAWTNLS